MENYFWYFDYFRVTMMLWMITDVSEWMSIREITESWRLDIVRSILSQYMAWPVRSVQKCFVTTAWNRMRPALTVSLAFQKYPELVILRSSALWIILLKAWIIFYTVTMLSNSVKPTKFASPMVLLLDQLCGMIDKTVMLALTRNIEVRGMYLSILVFWINITYFPSYDDTTPMFEYGMLKSIPQCIISEFLVNGSLQDFDLSYFGLCWCKATL